MPGDPRLDDSAEARASAGARRSGRRAAHGFVFVVAILFIASSTIQIVRGVFGLNDTAPPGDPCADGVARLAAQLEADPACGAGTATASGKTGKAAEETARARHARRALESSEAATVARTCAASSEGLETWAAFERGRMAREQLAQGDGDPRTGRGVMHAPPLDDEAAPLPADLR
jgi:hypothetical protein